MAIALGPAPRLAIWLGAEFLTGTSTEVGILWIWLLDVWASTGLGNSGLRLAANASRLTSRRFISDLSSSDAEEDGSTLYARVESKASGVARGSHRRAPDLNLLCLVSRA